MSDERTPLTEPIVFRRIFQGIYALLLVGFVATVAVSGTYGAFFAPVDPRETLPSGGDAADCRGRLGDLFDELEAVGQTLTLRVHEVDGAAEWKVFSDRFRGRLQAIRDRCGLDEPGRIEAAALADHLERHRLGYETALRSLRQIAGPSRGALVDALREPAAPADKAP